MCSVDTWVSSLLTYQRLVSFITDWLWHTSTDNKSSDMCSASFSEKKTRSRDCHQHITCLLLQKEKLLITAKKLTMTRTANYNLFVWHNQRIIELQGKQKQRKLYWKLTQSAEFTTHKGFTTDSFIQWKEELSGIVFDYNGVFDQLDKCNIPRKMTAVLPKLDSDTHIHSNSIHFTSLHRCSDQIR